MTKEKMKTFNIIVNNKVVGSVKGFTRKSARHTAKKAYQQNFDLQEVEIKKAS